MNLSLKNLMKNKNKLNYNNNYKMKITTKIYNNLKMT